MRPVPFEKETKKRLQESHDLTLTFDGTSIRKPATLYTTHATTPSRETYVITGRYDEEGKSEHHTAEWVKNKLSLVRALTTNRLDR